VTPAEIIAEALRLARAGAHDTARKVAYRLPAGAVTLDTAMALARGGAHEAAWAVAYRLPAGTGTLDAALALEQAGAYAAARAVHARIPGAVRHPAIGGFAVASAAGWLRVGCELRPYAEWVAAADAIAARHGSPGLAAQTRKLAERLAKVG